MFDDKDIKESLHKDSMHDKNGNRVLLYGVLGAFLIAFIAVLVVNILIPS